MVGVESAMLARESLSTRPTPLVAGRGPLLFDSRSCSFGVDKLHELADILKKVRVDLLFGDINSESILDRKDHIHYAGRIQTTVIEEICIVPNLRRSDAQVPHLDG